MLNSGDILLTEIFYLLFPAFLITLTILGVAYLYLKRFNRILQRYKHQKIHESENERKRIANDLHDFVAIKLLNIKNQLQITLNSSQDESVKDSLKEGISALNQFHEELRFTVEFIYPRDFIIGKLDESFLRMGKEMSNSDTNIIMDVEFVNELSKDKAHQLYRYLQESLANIISHRKVEKIYIGIFEDEEENHVELSISYPKSHPQEIKSTKNLLKYPGRGTTILSERLKILKAKEIIKESNDSYKLTLLFPIK